MILFTLKELLWLSRQAGKGQNFMLSNMPENSVSISA